MSEHDGDGLIPSPIGAKNGEIMNIIKVAHSPDADDAFMFYPLMSGKIGLGGLELADVREDIESLNKKAMDGIYDVTAVSFHVFPYIADKYDLLTTGACFGEGYGPIVVSTKSLKPKQLLKVRIGVPGKMTSAFLALRLYEAHLAGDTRSGICYSEVPFDQIMEQVKEGKLDAGLIIHEGQLNFADQGLHKIIDLGEWWQKETGLPLPLGGIAIRRDLDEATKEKIASLIQDSIVYALEHREECVQKALQYARGLDTERASKFIGMYVNEMTVDFGRKGLKAIKAFLERGYQRGELKKKIDLDDHIFSIKKRRPVETLAVTDDPQMAPQDGPVDPAMPILTSETADKRREES